MGPRGAFQEKKSMIDEYIVNFDEYVGAGSGSFGYIDGICYANTFSISDYIQNVEAGRLPIFARKNLLKKSRSSTIL